MRINLLLSLGILLGLIGASLLVAFGILYVKPYMMVRTMLLTTCTTSASFSTDPPVTCTCANDGSSSCLSKYPCLRIMVNFTTEDYSEKVSDISGEIASTQSSHLKQPSSHQVTNASLYNNFETFILQRHAKQCSYHKCSRSLDENYQAVVLFADEYGDHGQSYPCYYDPDDLSYVIMAIMTTGMVVHCMLWPAIALLLGMLIVSLYVCDVECLKAKKRRHRHQEQQQSKFNSTERPWTRHDNTTPYQKVLTIS